jgi:hypothetical protein
MSVEDFLLDEATLNGKTVSVQGVALCAGADTCFLYEGVTNLLQNTTFTPGSLSRDDRRRLLDCGGMLQYCSIVVTGRVKADAFMGGIVASHIDW